MLKELNEVTSFLATIATDQYQSLAADGLQVLEDFGYEDHVMPMLTCVSVANTKDDTQTLAEFNALLIYHLDAVLFLHHVTLSDEAPLTCYIKSVKGLFMAQNWLDRQRILDICLADAPANERFCELIKETIGGSEIEILENLEDIEEDTLERLAAVMSDDLPLDEEELLVDPEHIEKLRIYRDFIKDNKLIAFRLIRLGYKIGYNLEVYLTKAALSLDNLPNEQLVNEIIALLILGSDTWNQPIQGWRDKTQILNLELTERSSIDVALIKALGEFELYYNTRKGK